MRATNGAEKYSRKNDNNALKIFPAMQRIPKDYREIYYMSRPTATQLGMPLARETEGDEDMAQTVADGMAADKEAQAKVGESPMKGGNPLLKKIASEKETQKRRLMQPNRNCRLAEDSGTAKRRKMEADDERRRIADEAARIAGKAKKKSYAPEREEAERIERKFRTECRTWQDDKPVMHGQEVTDA